MNNLAHDALSKYQSTGNSSIQYDDPHQLIMRLLDGGIDRIAQAKGALQQNDNKLKGELIGKAIGIISGLSACLDDGQEGQLSANLSALYDYMGMRLLEANLENDITKLDEVSRLLGEIRSAWKQIPKLTQK